MKPCSDQVSEEVERSTKIAQTTRKIEGFDWKSAFLAKPESFNSTLFSMPAVFCTFVSNYEEVNIRTSPSFNTLTLKGPESICAELNYEENDIWVQRKSDVNSDVVQESTFIDVNVVSSQL